MFAVHGAEKPANIVLRGCKHQAMPVEVDAQIVRAFPIGRKIAN
jgi:hypothetical protein